MDLRLSIVEHRLFSETLTVFADGTVQAQATAVTSAATTAPAPTAATPEKQVIDSLELSEAALARTRDIKVATVNETTVHTTQLTLTIEERPTEIDFSSTGDPHLAVQAHGAAFTLSQHYDSQTSHGDLISASVDGGYAVSTVVTPINQYGVAYNDTATVTTNDGKDSVTLDRGGHLTIVSDGTTLAQPESTAPIALAGGAVVTIDASGNATVTATGAHGTVATVLVATGSGVDVHGSVAGFAIGGDIATNLLDHSSRVVVSPSS